MMPVTLDLVPIWTFILGVGVFLYVLLDGFDLGVGILFGFAPDTRSRNLIMNSIAPIWDGNETWLILGSVGLMAAFPLAFAIIIPAVYFPIAIMLLALVFRGVAFEFRYRDADHKSFWDHGFSWGSVIATFAQGIVLGAFIRGFKVDGRHFVGSSFDCFTPFSTALLPCSVASTAAVVAFWISFRIVRTCEVACFDCSARLFTSCATTTKPLPCSPAFAASIAALTASRFDCSARSFTDAMISPIDWLCSLSLTTLSAIDSIWVWIFFMPSMEVSTDLRPAWATCVACCALSETDLAF